MSRKKRFVLGVLVLLFIVMFRNPFSSGKWSVEDSLFGKNFRVTSVTWMSSTMGTKADLDWEVTFKNPTGFETTGDRGVGVRVSWLDEDGHDIASDEGFIARAVPGKQTITGSLSMDQAPARASVRFIE